MLDFCIIGFPKCGTTVLTSFLQKYENFNLIYSSKINLEEPIFRYNNSDIKKYLAKKEVKNKKNFIKDPLIIFDDVALYSVKKYNKDIKIIICIREKDTYLRSFYNNFFSENFDFKDELIYRTNIKNKEEFMGSEFSENVSNFDFYIEKVKCFFNPKNIIIIKMEDLEKNKKKEIEKIIYNII